MSDPRLLNHDPLPANAPEMRRLSAGLLSYDDCGYLEAGIEALQADRAACIEQYEALKKIAEEALDQIARIARTPPASVADGSIENIAVTALTRIKERK